MIWFNIKKLENKINSNEFPDKEGFKYFLAVAILGVLVNYTNSPENTTTGLTLISLIILSAIAIWGSYSIFKTNSSGDGQDFFKRYFALSWVIGFRLFVYTFIVALPLSIIYYTIIKDNNAMEPNIQSNEFVTMIISSLLMLIYYLLLTNSFKRVSHKK